MRHLAFIPILFALFIVAPLAAQDTPADTGWSVEQRCVGDPTPPPADWTYDGTILLTGYAGIHGVDAAWETPRVLTFLNEDNLWGGALSPDGSWYASPRGYFTITESYNGITEIHELRVFPVNGQRDTYFSIPYETEFYQYTHGQVYWKDNSQFLYFDMMNPFTGVVQAWQQPEYVWDAEPYTRQYFSPDWKRQVFYGYVETATGSVWDWKINDLVNNEILRTLNITSPVAWKPDSSGFGAVITDGADIPTYSLGLFDRDGVQGDVIVSAPDREFGLFAIGWSADSRYLAFIDFPFNYYMVEGKAYSFAYYDSGNTLYIADMQEKNVIDTCLTVGEGIAWSPQYGVEQLALMPPGEGLKDVLILDLDAGALHPIAKQLVTYNRRIYQGRKSSYTSIIGWRTD